MAQRPAGLDQTGTTVGDSAAILNRLLHGTQQSMASLEEKAKRNTELDQQMVKFEREFDEASKIENEAERSIRLRVLESNFEELSKIRDKDRGDFAKAVFAVTSLVEKAGIEFFRNLDEFTSQEKRPIEAGERELAAARVARGEADRKWLFKADAIADAERRIQKAEQQVKEVQRNATLARRERLLNADLEANLNEYRRMVRQVLDILKQERDKVDLEFQAVMGRKERAFQLKEQAAKGLEGLEAELQVAEADIMREEEHLRSLAANSEAHSAQDAKVSELRRKWQEITGRRNAVLAFFQSKERYAKILEIHERTHLIVRDTMDLMITSLNADAEEQEITFRSTLQAKKAEANVEVGKFLDDVGIEAEERHTTYMAQLAVSSSKMVLGKIKKHPQHLAKIVEAGAALAEHGALVRREWQEIIKEFREQYGFDPEASSIFHYAGGGEGEDDSPRPPAKRELF